MRLTDEWHGLTAGELPKLLIDRLETFGFVRDVMNLHGTAEQVAALVDGERYFPGWHMNRKYWYTVCLDGSIPMYELQRRIDESFELSQSKKRSGS